jgi:urocanate hydratase
MSEADNIERTLDKAADVLGSRDRAEEWLDRSDDALSRESRAAREMFRPCWSAITMIASVRLDTVDDKYQASSELLLSQVMIGRESFDVASTKSCFRTLARCISAERCCPGI